MVFFAIILLIQSVIFLVTCNVFKFQQATFKKSLNATIKSLCVSVIAVGIITLIASAPLAIILGTFVNIIALAFFIKSSHGVKLWKIIAASLVAGLFTYVTFVAITMYINAIFRFQ